jgi:hypothetical protein
MRGRRVGSRQLWHRTPELDRTPTVHDRDRLRHHQSPVRPGQARPARRSAARALGHRGVAPRPRPTPTRGHPPDPPRMNRHHDRTAEPRADPRSFGLSAAAFSICEIQGEADDPCSARRAAQRRRAVTIQARESNQIPSSPACAASVSRSRLSARSAATGSSRFSTSFVHVKPRTQSSAAATSGP